MKTRIVLRWVFVSIASISALTLTGISLTSTNASAASPSASASASVSALASASASAAAVEPPKRPPPLEQLEKQTIPTEKSPVPKYDEWQAAPLVEVAHRGANTSDCSVTRVREWLKVRCFMNIGAVYQHAGNPEGVSFWVSPKTDVYTDFDNANGAEMIFPLRQGDRRLLQFYNLGHDPCFGIGFDPGIMVEETWLEGEPGPIVVVRW